LRFTDLILAQASAPNLVDFPTAEFLQKLLVDLVQCRVAAVALYRATCWASLPNLHPVAQHLPRPT